MRAHLNNRGPALAKITVEHHVNLRDLTFALYQSSLDRGRIFANSTINRTVESALVRHGAALTYRISREIETDRLQNPEQVNTRLDWARHQILRVYANDFPIGDRYLFQNQDVTEIV